MTDRRDALRQRLRAADVMMRYDYAWKHSEFGQKVDRLTGVCLRFLYLVGTWMKNEPIRVACRSLTPSTPLSNAVKSACEHMEFAFLKDGDEQPSPHIMFCFIGPSEMGRVEECMAQSYPLHPNCIYIFLVGDAACLAQPKSGEEERIRGLSAFGIGRELQACMERRQFHAAAHYVCEFKENMYTDTLGHVMDQFNVPQTNLMIHTEKYEIYLHEGTEIPAVDDEDDQYWQQLSKGKVCENCREQAPKLLRCVRCQQAYYCSRACQKAAWKLHKGECNEVPRS